MMKLSRRLGLVAVATCAGIALIPAGPAFAKGGGGDGGGGHGGGGGGTSETKLTVFDTCGGSLVMKKSSPDALTVGITEPADQNETWSLQAFETPYDVKTGGRTFFPVSMASVFRSFEYEGKDNGFSSSATLVDPPDSTLGFSYTATRTSPSPLTCSGEGFWTDHGDSIVPDPLNPTAKPDTAPALTGVNVAKAGTNTVSVGFDQEMLATAAPTGDSFAVTVDGVSREVVEVRVVDDSPPDKAAVALVLAGDPLPVGANVTVQYQKPSASAEQLQDLDGLSTPSFGPVSFTVQS